MSNDNDNDNSNNNNNTQNFSVPEHARLDQGSSAHNVFDNVNSLRQRLTQLENRVGELSRICPSNNNQPNVKQGYRNY